MLNKFHITANQNNTFKIRKSLEDINSKFLDSEKEKHCSQVHPERKDNLPKVI